MGRIYGFDPKNSALVIPTAGVPNVSPLFPKNVLVETATQAGYRDGSLVKFQKHNIYPRIGLAYKLTADGKTAIRAGYGLYGNTIYGALASSSRGGPFAGSTTLFNSITNGSALLTLPAPALSLEDKRTVTRALLTSGATISEMNCLRKHLSAIKGGRLAAAAVPARVVSLAISDVPGDDPAVIASGPTVPDPTTFADARAILENQPVHASGV